MISKPLKQLTEMKKLSSSMRLAAEEWNQPWQTLVSTILSARTRDETTIPISNELFRKYHRAEDLASASMKEVKKIIRPVNFYKVKAKHIIKCAKILAGKYKGEPPVDFGKLLELPGVGRKTANIFLREMGKDAIAVDTHVAYISQRLGWTESKKPEKIEDDLKKLFPKRYWKDVNATLVRFGKTYMSRRKKDEILESIRKL